MNHPRRRPLQSRLADALAAHLLAVLLYPFVLWAYREERKAGQR